MKFSAVWGKERDVYPVHKNIQKLIKEEWQKSKKVRYYEKLKSREVLGEFNPLEEEDCANWVTIPKVDVPVANVAKHTSLPFEDTSQLKDPMEKL